VFKSIRLDHYIFKQHYSIFLIVYAVSSLIAAVSKTPQIAVAISLVLTAPLIGTYFSIYEKNNLGRLFGVLPLIKRDAVTGRYIFALMIAVTNGIISGVLAYIISFFIHGGIDMLEFLSYLSLAFFYFCLTIAVLFPLYFRFPFSKVYAATNLPFYLLFVLGIYLTKKTDILKNLADVLKYFTSHQYMIWVTGFGSGLLMLIISWFIACRVYKKADF
jgi:hypothetical protein